MTSANTAWFSLAAVLFVLATASAQDAGFSTSMAISAPTAPAAGTPGNRSIVPIDVLVTLFGTGPTAAPSVIRLAARGGNQVNTSVDPTVFEIRPGACACTQQNFTLRANLSILFASRMIARSTDVVELTATMEQNGAYRGSSASQRIDAVASSVLVASLRIQQPILTLVAGNVSHTEIIIENQGNDYARIQFADGSVDKEITSQQPGPVTIGPYQTTTAAWTLTIPASSPPGNYSAQLTAQAVRAYSSLGESSSPLPLPPLTVVINVLGSTHPPQLRPVAAPALPTVLAVCISLVLAPVVCHRRKSRSGRAGKQA